MYQSRRNSVVMILLCAFSGRCSLLQLFFKDYAAAHLKLSELGQFQN